MIAPLKVSSNSIAATFLPPGYFGAFTLEPVTQAGKTTYLAHGKVDFFGDEAMARTGGAGGQNRTGYARLFRAALYQ